MTRSGIGQMPLYTLLRSGSRSCSDGNSLGGWKVCEGYMGRRLSGDDLTDFHEQPVRRLPSK
jgi:hypothetical protein